VILGIAFLRRQRGLRRKHTQHVSGSAIAAPIVITATLFIWLMVSFYGNNLKIPALPGT